MRTLGGLSFHWLGLFGRGMVKAVKITALLKTLHDELRDRVELALVKNREPEELWVVLHHAASHGLEIAKTRSVSDRQ